MTPNTGKEMDLEAVKALREHRRQLDEDGVIIGVSRQALDEVLAEVERLRSRAEKAEAFKTWTHERLDREGVPKVIEDDHLANGCRIGGRMDWVFGEIERLRAEVQRKDELLGSIESWMRTEAEAIGCDAGNPDGGSPDACEHCDRIETAEKISKALSPDPSHQEGRRLLESVVEAARSLWEKMVLVGSFSVQVKNLGLRLSEYDAHRKKRKKAA